MSRSLLRCTFAVAFAVTLSSSASAQAVAPSETIAPPSTELTAPTITAPAIGAPTIAAPTTIAPAMQSQQLFLRPAESDVAPMVVRRESFGRPAVLMITGGALLLTGLLVDGDASSILIISGAAIGGYGLFLHLQSPNARLVR